MTILSTLFNDLATAKDRKAQYKAGVTFARTNAVPLDRYSVFPDYLSAKTYVSQAEDNVAYPGQVVAVYEDGIQNLYVLDPSAQDGLRKLASGGDASTLQSALTALSSEILN